MGYLYHYIAEDKNDQFLKVCHSRLWFIRMRGLRLSDKITDPFLETFLMASCHLMPTNGSVMDIKQKISRLSPRDFLSVPNILDFSELRTARQKNIPPQVNPRRDSQAPLRLVRRMRLELTRANAHYPLKVACLPFHHLRRWSSH